MKRNKWIMTGLDAIREKEAGEDDGEKSDGNADVAEEEHGGEQEVVVESDDGENERVTAEELRELKELEKNVEGLPKELSFSSGTRSLMRREKISVSREGEPFHLRVVYTFSDGIVVWTKPKLLSRKKQFYDGMLDTGKEDVKRVTPPSHLNWKEAQDMSFLVQFSDGSHNVTFRVPSSYDRQQWLVALKYEKMEDHKVAKGGRGSMSANRMSRSSGASGKKTGRR